MTLGKLTPMATIVSRNNSDKYYGFLEMFPCSFENAILLNVPAAGANGKSPIAISGALVEVCNE